MKLKLPAVVVGTFTVFILLPITCIAQAPANDTCNGAIALTNGVPYTSNTAGATTNGDAQGSGCVLIEKGVWFTYTPGTDGLVVVDTCGSSFMTALTVFTNSCGGLGRLTCGYYDNGFCALRQLATFTGKAETTYRILAGGDSNFVGGSGTLRVTACLGPKFASEVVFGTNVILSGTCGAAGTNFYVLASTDAALPLTNWVRLLTNKFSANGNFTFTNAITPGNPHRFFVIQVP
jgi:hypothetical protein